MTLKSIEKLRGIVQETFNVGNLAYDPGNRIMDGLREIEAEIAERFVELPVDADGEPIHIGDAVEFGENRNQGIVKALNEHMVIAMHVDDGYTNYAKYGLLWNADACRHVEPDPLIALLDEFATDVANYKYDGVDFDTYAERIRELLGVER